MNIEELSNEIKSLKELIQENLLQVKEHLTVPEAAKYLAISTSSLYKMTCQKKIPHYSPRGKLYFKRSELDTWIKKSKSFELSDIESEAADYLLKNKKVNGFY